MAPRRSTLERTIARPDRLPVETSVRAVSSDGSGIGALADGRVLFVPRTAPGDRVRVEVERVKKNWARGRLLDVLEPAPDRVDPECALYDACGGCALQHLPYAEELSWKGRWIADALARIGGRDVQVPEVVPGSGPMAYRGRVTFTLRRLAGREPVAGFHRLDAPNRLVDVHAECRLPVGPLADVWVRLREAWGEGARRLPGGPKLRLTLRVGEEGVGLFVQGGRSRGDVRRLLEEVDGLVAIWLEDDRGRRSHGAGLEALTESWLGDAFRLRADTFVQVNRPAAEPLMTWVLEQARAVSPRTAIDAYAGVGVYGRALARRGVATTAIEVDSGAVEAASRDVPAGFEIVEGKVEEALGACLPVDVLVVNPPRTGLHADVPGAVDSLDPERRPRRIVYVSCNPATLARDLERLGPTYEITAVRGWDLFPRTAHVETVVVLDRTP